MAASRIWRDVPKLCIRRGEFVDGVRTRRRRHWSGPAGKTVSNPEHELEGVVVNVPWIGGDNESAGMNDSKERLNENPG